MVKPDLMRTWKNESEKDLCKGRPERARLTQKQAIFVHGAVKPLEHCGARRDIGVADKEEIS